MSVGFFPDAEGRTMAKRGTKLKEKLHSLKTSFSALPLRCKFLWLFVSLSVVCVLLYLLYIYLFFAPGKDLYGPDFLSGSIFFQDVGDVFMDFFNINFMVSENNPYFVEGDPGGGSSYPPLILTIAKFFSLIGGKAETARALRATARGIFSLVLYFSIFFAGAWLVLRAYAKKVGFSLKETIFLYVSLVLSAPMLYLIDRGNYLTYTLLFLGIFFLYEDSASPVLREVSYLALACAVGSKLYPLVFAFLLLREKRYYAFLRVSLYSLALCFLPFFFFEGGIRNVVWFAENLTRFSTEPYSFWSEGVRFSTGTSNDLAVDNLVHVFALLVSGCSFFELPDWVFGIGFGVRVLFAVFTVGSLFLATHKWQAVLGAALAVLLLPSPSYAYTAAIMLFPFVLFLAEDRGGRKNIAYFVLFLCELLTIDLGFLLPTWSHGLQHGYATIDFIQGIAACALAILTFCDSLKGRLYRKNHDKNHPASLS